MSSSSPTLPSNSAIYTPLPSPTSIRLIKLNGYASHPQRNDQLIDISLETVDVKTAPPYDALSYTWDDPLCRDLDACLLPPIPNGPHEIYCNGAAVTIKPNLLDALKMLLSANVLHGNSENDGLARSPHIWIDALCINQSDKGEIAAQVSIMGSIYLRAEKVIAWLGPEDATIPDALSVLDRLAVLGRDTDFTEESQTALAHIDERLFLHPEEHKEKLGIEPIQFREWLCFLAFLSRPYFSRVWIVQEITLARKLVPVCGSRLLDWDKIKAASLFLHYTNWDHFLNYSSLLAPSVVRDRGIPEEFETFLKSRSKAPFALIGLIISKMQFRTTDWLELRRSGNLPQNWTIELVCAINLSMEATALFELIEIHRPCLATDPRDKVYGLLGISGVKRSPLADMTLVLDGHIPRLITVDYKITVEEVYTRACRAIIDQTGDLEILQIREGDDFRVLKSLPSWVPDFSTELLPARLRMLVPFSAAGETRWEFPGHLEPTLPPSLLPVKGVFLGAIADQTPWRPGVKDYYQHAARIASTLPPFYTVNSDTSKPTETRLEVLARTCLTNTFDRRSEIPPHSPELRSEFLYHIADIVSSTDLTITTTQEDGKVVEQTVPVRLRVNKQIMRPPSPPMDAIPSKTQRSQSLPNLDFLSLTDHHQQPANSHLLLPPPVSAISPHPHSAITPNNIASSFANDISRTAGNHFPDETARSPKEVIVVDPSYNIPAQEALHEYLMENPLFRLIMDEPGGSPFSLSALSDAVTDITENTNNPTTSDGEDKENVDEGGDWFRRGRGARYRAAADWYTLGSRRVFVTGSGLLGLGPLSAEVGDEIWVLEGGKTPLVLRRREGENNRRGEGEEDAEGGAKQKAEDASDSERLRRYEFIGPAYVHGVMHGEALDMGKESVAIILE